VQALRPAAQNLAALTPDLGKTFDVLNYVLNELAYNPPGDGVGEEGYLFWLLWANHAGDAVFNTQDAHGPIRRGQFLVSCTSAGVLQSVANVNPTLKTLVDLLNPIQSTPVCPSQAGAGSTGGGGGGTTTVPSVTTPVVTTPSVTVPTP
jgi:phospholipid/cholesterol/gamma-HCH transport system substrate-binding protein